MRQNGPRETEFEKLARWGRYAIIFGMIWGAVRIAVAVGLLGQALQ